MKVLVTGGAGFIGSAVVRMLLRETDATVVNVDKLTYAASLDSLGQARCTRRHRLERIDIADGDAIAACIARHQPDAVLHLAAESHVDRSIDGPRAFLHTNVVGTYVLLEATRQYWLGLPAERRRRFRFQHVSTDEVYGSLGETGSFCESSPYRPSSPYSATKAASDHLVRAWHETYGLPTLITNCSNNYGPCQFPEKLIPLMILNAVDGAALPVYGRGDQVRDWLYVEDHARALHRVLVAGAVGETYNIGGDCERTNIEVVQRICDLLEQAGAEKPEGVHRFADLITHVEDRPGHDKRYAIDCRKIKRDLGWKPRESFDSGLEKTVQWYLHHRQWCRRTQRGGYRRTRLGRVAA